MRRSALVRTALLAAVTLFAGRGVSVAREVKGVDFPETVTIKNSNCTLMGVGVRKKIIINVYLGALYLENPVSGYDAVISSDQKKRIHMHILYREIGADQLIEAWNEGFSKNAADLLPSLEKRIMTFNSFFTEPVNKGDTITVTYIPGTGTEVTVKGVKKGVIEGSDFMEAVFSIWFGPHPPSDGLKEGMMGED